MLFCFVCIEKPTNGTNGNTEQHVCTMKKICSSYDFIYFLDIDKSSWIRWFKSTKTRI